MDKVFIIILFWIRLFMGGIIVFLGSRIKGNLLVFILCLVFEGFLFFR